MSESLLDEDGIPIRKRKIIAWSSYQTEWGPLVSLNEIGREFNILQDEMDVLHKKLYELEHPHNHFVCPKCEGNFFGTIQARNGEEMQVSCHGDYDRMSCGFQGQHKDHVFNERIDRINYEEEHRHDPAD